MKITITGIFPFPYGSAGASRMRNLALAMHDSGAEVHVIATAATLPIKGFRKNGCFYTYQGVTFELPNQRSLKSPKWSIKGITHSVISYLGLWACHSIARSIAEGRCDVLLVYGRGTIQPPVLIAPAYMSSTPTLLDVTEHYERPEPFGSSCNPVYWDIKAGNFILPRLFDGFTVISTQLEKMYRQQGCKQVLLVPPIQDFSCLPAPGEIDHSDGFRLLYVGSLIKRDAPDMLFQTMAILAGRQVPVVLEVVGGFERSAEGQRWGELFRTDPLLRRCVKLVGWVSDEELGAKMSSAHGLILMRKNNACERYAFPTRLSEYLRQGKPVFVTDVGDISLYLRDGIDAILLNPDSPHLVAEAIAKIVASSDRGGKIGRQGQKRGAESFDRQVHAVRILEFAETILHEKRRKST